MHAIKASDVGGRASDLNPSHIPINIMLTTQFTTWKSRTNGKYYWHAKRRGRIVADGGQGYKSLRGLMKSLRSLMFSNFNFNHKDK